MVHRLYVVSVWIHILAVTVWLGGMLFLVLVVVPWLRTRARPEATALLRDTGERFRSVGWICFVVLLITGTFNLWARGVRVSDFGRLEWLQSPFGKTVLVKLVGFSLVLLVSAVHDFYLGPRAVRVIEADPHSRAAQIARRRASMLGRVNVLLAVILIGAGVMLVRGVPW